MNQCMQDESLNNYWIQAGEMCNLCFQWLCIPLKYFQNSFCYLVRGFLKTILEGTFSFKIFFVVDSLLESLKKRGLKHESRERFEEAILSVFAKCPDSKILITSLNHAFLECCKKFLLAIYSLQEVAEEHLQCSQSYAVKLGQGYYEEKWLSLPLLLFEN